MGWLGKTFNKIKHKAGQGAHWLGKTAHKAVNGTKSALKWVGKVEKEVGDVYRDVKDVAGKVPGGNELFTALEDSPVGMAVREAKGALDSGRARVEAGLEVADDVLGDERVRRFTRT
jgi:hypothetical protein